ncbi:MAG: hypothetical protein GXY76_00350 [Chloroflexi bacterium]|nr:hypothetical protein [Chloroflexota bacterium]
MQIQVSPDYPYPSLFVISSRASGAAAPPAQAVGVLVVKQTVWADGAIPPKEQQQPILLADALVDPPGADAASLEIYLESDLAADKPTLDVVAARNHPARGYFGRIRIDRQDGAGYQPAAGTDLDWGWQSRTQGNDPPSGAANPRPGQAGDVAAFAPETSDPAKLPVGFDNAFYNGGRLRDLARLKAGDWVQFSYWYGVGWVVWPVAIPAGPQLAITVGGAPIDPPVSLALHADTVVWDMTTWRFAIVWRAVFPWEERLAAAVLEVH